jgi:hypothetical protein
MPEQAKKIVSDLSIGDQIEAKGNPWPSVRPRGREHRGLLSLVGLLANLTLTPRRTRE